MPEFKILILTIPVIFGSFQAVAQKASSENSTTEKAVGFPEWLSAPADARNEQCAITGDDTGCSYRVPRPPAAVSANLQQQLKNNGIKFNASFDGIGPVIRCMQMKESCVIQIREGDEGSSVKVSYSPTAGSAVNVVGASESTPTASTVSAAPPVTTSPPPTKAAPEPGRHQIEYIIEGNTRTAALTYRNADGGSEQNEVVLPTTLRFTMLAGAFAYISAQKKVQVGTVRVEIKVDGIVMRQSTSSAPYGIATASGRVVDRQIVY